MGVQFRRAAAAGDYRGARLLALEMPRVSLETALALTFSPPRPVTRRTRRWRADG